MSDLISVIVPVYNVADCLPALFVSLVHQTYDRFEILLINDGSTDCSGALCEEFAAKYKKARVFHKSNGGLSDARNFGLAHAKGEFITFIDSDDCVDQVYLSTLYQGMKLTNSKVSICDYLIVRDGECEQIQSGSKSGSWLTFSRESALMKVFIGKIPISACGKLYSKDLFADMKFPVGLHYEDAEIIPKIIAKCPSVCYIDSPLYKYRIREGSITHQPLTERSFDRIEQACSIQIWSRSFDKDVQRAADYYVFWQRCAVLRMDEKGTSLEVSHRIENEYSKAREMAYRVLRTRCFPSRGKAAAILLLFGRHVFSFGWKIYSIFTGR